MTFHPAIEPYAHGMLDVGDGQSIYWEECGNPAGKPAVTLHGGPGSGCTPGSRRLVDPDAYRLVLLDQRGCGRSRPPAGDPATSLEVNTTDHLVADLELLREHRGIERWLVHGASWGATLAQAYVQAHPERVTEVVLGDVTTTSREEVAWLSRGVGRFFPQQWERLRDGAAAALDDPGDPDSDLTAAYARLLASPDAAVRADAAREWCAWEQALVSTDPGARRPTRYDDPVFAYGFARVVTHYFSHTAWLADGQLLRGAADLGSVPAVLVHGRLDLQGPLVTAWAVHRAWPGSELVICEDAGHTSPSLGAAMAQALDRFARV